MNVNYDLIDSLIAEINSNDRLWKDCPKEERKIVKEWCLAQTGIVRAYKKGELTGMQYRGLKSELEYLLNQIERKYA